MNAFDSDTFLNSVSLALNKPIETRCGELTLLLERATIKDLQHLFPLLIDNIFGPQGTISWGLKTITANLKPQDFQALQHFFSPMGPMFKVIYALVKDPLIKYDFSITYLPTKIRQLLDAGSVHPFYSDLVHISPQNKQIVSLLLNPFDYYMFHFAYHLINPWHQRNDDTLGITWNTVYYVLCCDYVLHFFPTSPTPVLPPVGIGGKLTTIQQPTFTQQLSSPNHPPTKLLKKEYFNDPMGEYSKLHPPLDKHPRAEIWRSESVLTIFLDMWLNNDQISQPQENFNMNITTKTSLHFNEVPAGEYVRIIRALVKQLHAFAASQKIDDGHMVELKKITLPIMQGKMYIFLRNLIHRWPLDGSFRLVLELWLSFIQPWRYAVITPSRNVLSKPTDLNLDADDANVNAIKGVDHEYIPFIAENILAYVVIFQQLLPRFLRVDLSSPKNSLMLYRLAKVFDQPNLVTFIKKIENCIEENNITPNHNYTSYMNNTMPPLSPTLQWSTNKTYLSNTISPINSEDVKQVSSDKDRTISTKYAVIVKQKIHELEGRNFCYKPLFIAPPAPEVYELLKHISRARVTAIDIIDHRNAEYKKQTSGFFGFIKQLYINVDSMGDDFTLEDRKKVPGYLDFASQYLCDMFSINEALINESFGFADTSSRPSIIQDDNSFPKLLTPEKVRERIYSMKFEGDPELQPIKTYEVTILVRMFYHWASKINENYGPQIKKLYENPTYLGKIARQIISPPITIFKYDKSNYGKPKRIAERLPPRISLRFFASYQFWIYIGLGILISTLFHYSIPSFLFFIFSCWFCLICVKALFDKSGTERAPNPLGNLSFDQSF